MTDKLGVESRFSISSHDFLKAVLFSPLSELHTETARKVIVDNNF